jgi:hypothetical protein
MKPTMFQFFLPLSIGKKRYILFFILIFFCCYLKAQVVNSGNFYIAGNMFVNTDFTNNSTATYQNDGAFFLTGDFQNDQFSMAEGIGTTSFIGTTLQRIKGSQPANFHDVVWSNAAGVKMFKNVMMGGMISPISGSLYFNNYALAMGGKINTAYTNTSAFSVTKGSDLLINGDAASGNKLYFDPSANTIHDVNVSSSGSGVLGNALNITAGSTFGTVTANGTLDAAGFLTLKSDADGTARVANSSGTITNYVTVERYIPPRRAWRFMAAPINNDTLTIRTAWQEGANNHDLDYANHQDPHPGYGTDITYDNDWTKGFDVNTTSNPSIRTWIQSLSTWNVAPPTTTTALTAYPAYYLFVRGSRAVHLEWATGAPTDPTILRETGTLNNGTYTKTYAANPGDYLFVGNPFASSINLSDMFSASTGIVNDKFYVWDPALNGSYGVGGYVTYAHGTMVPLTTNYPAPTTIIQGEQGFMLQATAASAKLVFNQDCKVATEADIFGKPKPQKNPLVYVNLMLHSADSLLLVDGTGAIFDSKFSADVDLDDAIKFPNQNENISMVRNNRRIAVEARPNLVLTDTLFLRMTYLNTNYPYALAIKPVNTPAAMQAWLIDKYLNKRTPLKLTDTTVYDFTANYYDTSTYMRRFIIVYRKGLIATPAPVKKLIATPVPVEATAKTLNGSVTILPNPVTGSSFNINLVSVSKGNYKAEIFTSNGRLILTKRLEHSGSTFSYKTNLPPGIAAGIYTVSITNSNNELVQKVSLVVSKN